MVIRVHSRRYAGRMVRVGRLLVVFHGEYAELPEWATRERDWMLARIPGIFAAAEPRSVCGPDQAAVGSPEPVAVEPAAETLEDAANPAASDTPLRQRDGGRKRR